MCCLFSQTLLMQCVDPFCIFRCIFLSLCRWWTWWLGKICYLFFHLLLLLLFLRILERYFFCRFSLCLSRWYARWFRNISCQSGKSVQKGGTWWWWSRSLLLFGRLSLFCDGCCCCCCCCWRWCNKKTNAANDVWWWWWWCRC